MSLPFRALTLWAALGVVAFAQDGPRDVALPDRAPSTKAPQKKASLAPAFTEFCNVPGEPTAAVPGMPGITFRPDASGVAIFGRPFVSPNGNVAFTALTNQLAGSDEVILKNGAVRVQEGAPAPFHPGNVIGPLDPRIGINDAGDVVFVTNTAPGTANDDFVIRVTAGGTFVVVAQEGQPLPALPGATHDDDFASVTIVADGRVGFEADRIDGAGIGPGNDEIYVFGPGLLAQEGLSIPFNPILGSMDAWSSFDPDGVWLDAQGNHSLIRGDTKGATFSDDVLAWNGTVVLEEGFVVPGAGFIDVIDEFGLVGSEMDLGGNWYARGHNDGTGDDWVVRNGTLIAAVTHPVTSASTELWSDASFADCFFAHTGNAAGHFVVGGVTNAANADADAVLVLDGETIVCREGDPVDLDNNGAFDDDAFFDTFGNDDLALTEACALYFTATIRDGAGVRIGHGMFRLDLPCGCGLVTAYGAGCAGSGGFVPSLDFGGCAASGGSLVVEVDGALGGAPSLLFVGTSPLSVVVPNSPCKLFVNPRIAVGLPLSGVGPGNGALTLPAPLPPTVPAGTVYAQVFVADSGVTHGFAVSNAVQIDFP